jgi:hypothetical protein
MRLFHWNSRQIRCNSEKGGGNIIAALSRHEVGRHVALGGKLCVLLHGDSSEVPHIDFVAHENHRGGAFAGKHLRNKLVPEPWRYTCSFGVGDNEGRRTNLQCW